MTSSRVSSLSVRALLLAAAFLFAAADAAFSQRILVVTQTLSATGNAAAVYGHSVSFDNRAVLPGANALPGVAVCGPLLTTPSGLSLICTGAEERESAAPLSAFEERVTLFRPSPFEPVVSNSPSLGEGWRGRVACIAEDQRTRDVLAIRLASRTAAASRQEGLLRVERYDRRSGAFLDTTPPPEWPLPGPPVDACTLSGSRVAVLCRDAAGLGTLLVIGDVLLEPVPPPPIAVAPVDSVSGESASALTLSNDGAWLFLAASGYQISGVTAEPLTRLFAVSVQSPGAARDSVTGHGAVFSPARCLVPCGARGCWAVTFVQGMDVGYATRVRKNAKGELEKEKEYALPQVSAPPLLAVRPHAEDVAIALDSAIEIWPDGDRQTIRGAFDAPLDALLWSDEGLFAAEAHRLHLLRTDTAASSTHVPLASGRIAQLALVPQGLLPPDDTDADGLTAGAEQHAGTSPDNPDSDADGIPDGVDPEPKIPSPRLNLPRRIVFHGRAVGKEIRALAAVLSPGLSARWCIEFDAGAMDWIVATPRSGRSPEPCYLAVNPARYQRGAAAHGNVRYVLEGADADRDAYGSPADIAIEIAATPEGPKRVLWLPRAQERRLDDLCGLLAGMPFNYSIEVPQDRFLDDLSPYELIVMDAETAAGGVIARQTLLDFVMEGGALLFLGQHLPEAETHPINHLLSPLEFAIEPSAEVSCPRTGQLIAESDNPNDETSYLAAFWPGFDITQGCRISAPDACSLARDARDPGNALFAARAYGYGRVAALASAEPLAALNGPVPGARRFAMELVAWLALAGVEIEDMDGDGLPDSIEDVNDNGAWDPGETNYLHADTDEDGIPDGMEDQNRNGILDDGETDPRNLDSDSDGIPDGADVSACPLIGAPYVISIEGAFGPAEGPAEGGATVYIYGRNFTQDCTVWFGLRRAAARIQGSEYAIAVAPACLDKAGGVAPVRVLPAGVSPGALPGENNPASSFRYTPLSEARITIEPRETGVSADGAVSGELLVRVDLPDWVRAARAFVLLNVAPEGALLLGELEEAPSESAAPRLTVSHPAPDMSLLYTPDTVAPFSTCLLGRIKWRVGEGVSPDGIRIKCDGAMVTSLTGVPLNTVCTLISPLEHVPDAAPPTRSRAESP